MNTTFHSQAVVDPIDFGHTTDFYNEEFEDQRESVNDDDEYDRQPAGDYHDSPEMENDVRMNDFGEHAFDHGCKFFLMNFTISPKNNNFKQI